SRVDSVASSVADATASAAARSTAGSVTFIPPTVAVYTSLLPNGTLIRRSSTASTMFTLAESSPLTARRGCASVESDTSACTSHNSGRLPSTVTVMAVPGTGSLPPLTNSPEGSTTSTMPSSTSSKQPISSAAPKRFFTPRTNRGSVPPLLACYPSLLGHGPHPHHRDVTLLGQGDQTGGDRADLRHATG